MLGYLIYDSRQAISTLGFAFTHSDWDPIHNRYGRWRSCTARW